LLAGLFGGTQSINLTSPKTVAPNTHALYLATCGEYTVIS